MGRTLPVLAAFALIATPAAAQAEIVATPTGPWQASSEGGLCRMERSFEAEGRPHLLIVEQNAPGSRFGLAFAGPSLARFSEEIIGFSSAPVHLSAIGPMTMEDNRQFAKVIILKGVQLLTTFKDALSDGERMDTGPVDVTAATAAERIVVSQGTEQVTFGTGSLGEVAQTLNACTAKMLTSWGLDPEVQYRLQRPAAPVDSDRLMTQMRNAYARTALRTLQQGTIELVVLTDASGKAIGCRMLIATGYENLDRAMCATAMKERFQPALGADGQATASYWRLRTSLRVAFSG